MPTVSRTRGAPAHGLTLVEILVIVTLLVIGATVGVPSMHALIDRHRVTATTNQFLTALYFTRSEAVRLNVTATLCASRDGKSCTGPDWTHGWIVYRNPQSAPQPANGADILRATSLPAGRHVEINGNTPVREYISYSNAGISRRHSGALQMGTVRLCGHRTGRALILNAGGRPRTATQPCEPS